jgi:glycosyltransferase involved in cell wall biosynthesis
MIGHLRPEKRHEVALRALRRLQADGGEDVRLCVVGDGPCRGELEALAGALGVAESVTWVGAVPDAGRLVRAFDVTLLSSAYEGMPLAALESLVAGVPVVATAVGGLPELLSAGAGELVTPGDDRELAEAIARVLDERDDADAILIRNRAFERARAAHGVAAMARAHEQVYDEVLSET